jgi:cytochrome c553
VTRRTAISVSIAVLAGALAPLFIGQPINAQEVLTLPEGLPEWAFNIPPKEQPWAVKVEGKVKAKGSAREYEAKAIAGNANPPDWFPEEHGPAPKIVTGGEGVRFACGSCHLMSGQSHAEAADIAGMPAAYLIRQMQYYKDGSRKEDARMGPIAKITSEEDVRAAAEYFSKQKPRVFVKVIETATPPKTFIATAGRHRQLHPEGGTEPIGQRIIQIPEDPFGTEIRDPHAGFIAYVPPGSIAKGEALVKNGACAACHGEGLKGKGEVPRLAGLQPLQVTRQLFLIQHGSSGGKGIEPMKPVVAKMTADDIIAISSYVGSLPPS